MSSKFGRNLIDLFINDLQNGIGIYEFLSEEVRPLNKLLFQTISSFQFQFDCLVLYKCLSIVAECLKHYQQGYNDLIGVVLLLVLD